MPAAVAPREKKKSKTKPVCAESDEEDAGPSQPDEETGPEIITGPYPWGRYEM